MQRAWTWWLMVGAVVVLAAPWTYFMFKQEVLAGIAASVVCGAVVLYAAYSIVVWHVTCRGYAKVRRQLLREIRTHDATTRVHHTPEGPVTLTAFCSLRCGWIIRLSRETDDGVTRVRREKIQFIAPSLAAEHSCKTINATPTVTALDSLAATFHQEELPALRMLLGDDVTASPPNVSKQPVHKVRQEEMDALLAQWHASTPIG